MKDCMRCVPIEPDTSHSGSYEDMSHDIEMNQAVSFKSSIDERTPLDGSRVVARRQTMKKLARQQSVMDTQKTGDLGSMQLTYWF